MRDDSKESGQADHSIAGILRRLNSVDPGPAWSEFLDRYAQLIMNTANQFEYRQDRIDECFIYVCEQLNDSGFRRLLNFNTRGKASFSTWLGTVVFNLCVDWHRKEYGRATLSPAISALPAFDQSVYRRVIEQGMNKEEAYQILRADFPDLTREMVAEAVGRIFSLLTPRQRWRISVRGRGRRSGRPHAGGNRIDHLSEQGSGPETEAQLSEELEVLKSALSMLPPDQRLLLHLRFQEGMSLKKIAELQHLGDTNRAWRHVQAAVKAVTGHLERKNSGKKRKS